MAKRKKTSVGSLVMGFVMLLVIITIVGFVYKFTDGFTSEFKSFYLTYNGKVLDSHNALVLPRELENRFDCKYMLDFLDKSQKGYQVQIIPNSVNDFNYTVEGDSLSYKFSDVNDLTSSFDIALYDTYFVLTMPYDISVESVLSNYHDEKAVFISGITDMTKNSYFTIVVTSVDERYGVEIDFKTYVGLGFKEDSIYF